VKNFQGVSKFDDKYEGKTLVKMDPSSQGGVLKMDQNKKVQHKMALKQGLRDYRISKNAFVNHCGDFLGGGGGSFWTSGNYSRQVNLESLT